MRQGTSVLTLLLLLTAAACGPPAKARNSDISVQLEPVSRVELKVTLRNPGNKADTIHALAMGLAPVESYTADQECWSRLEPDEKALIPGETYRFTVTPDSLTWCRDHDASGKCIFRPLLECAAPGRYLARVYQHKDALNDPSSNSVVFEVRAKG